VPAGLKNYYQLLGIEPTASPDEVKRAFRAQIARYHPDKVQHLGREFQDMAAERAAELTEAYRVLSDATRRAEYDRLASTAQASPAAPAQSPPPPPAPDPAQPSPEAAAQGATETPPPAPAAEAAAFAQERASRDEFVRKAAVGRFRQALAQTGGSAYEEATVRGFDFAYTPKAKLFARRKGPRLLGRFVSRVDGEAVSAVWTDALRLPGASGDEICVFLMGSGMAGAPELAGAIAEQRRKPRGAALTVIPIDARDWDARIPTDAPEVARTVLARLRGQRA
jgi:curved DNA-binding protein CbpA